MKIPNTRGFLLIILIAVAMSGCKTVSCDWQNNQPDEQVCTGTEEACEQPNP